MTVDSRANPLDLLESGGDFWNRFILSWNKKKIKVFYVAIDPPLYQPLKSKRTPWHVSKAVIPVNLPTTDVKINIVIYQ